MLDAIEKAAPQVLVQAGGMGEHRFSEVRVGRAAQRLDVHDKVRKIGL